MNMADARKAMVDHQIRPADVVNYHVLEAFLSVKREHFVPEDKKSQAYGEYEIEFAPGRKMMRPRSLAQLVELAAPKAHEEVLLIGSGTGYEAAILAQLSNMVIAVGATANLVKKAEGVLANEGYDNAITIRGSLEKGAEKSGPYDLIFVNGAIEVLPKCYAEQLKDGGRIAAIFFEDGVYTARMAYVSDGRYAYRDYFQAYAPRLPGFERKLEFSF